MSVSSTHRSPPAHGNKLAIKLQMLLRDSIPIIVIKENADCYVRRLQPVLRTSLTMPDVGRSASDALQIELPAPGPKLSAGIVETRILNNSKLRRSLSRRNRQSAHSPARPRRRRLHRPWTRTGWLPPAMGFRLATRGTLRPHRPTPKHLRVLEWLLVISTPSPSMWLVLPWTWRLLLRHGWMPRPRLPTQRRFGVQESLPSRHDTLHLSCPRGPRSRHHLRPRRLSLGTSGIARRRLPLALPRPTLPRLAPTSAPSAVTRAKRAAVPCRPK